MKTDAEEALAAVWALVDAQAEDEALWALNLDGTLPISEAYLQQELRALHSAVEIVREVLNAPGEASNTRNSPDGLA